MFVICWLIGVHFNVLTLTETLFCSSIRKYVSLVTEGSWDTGPLRLWGQGSLSSWAHLNLSWAELTTQISMKPWSWSHSAVQSWHSTLATHNTNVTIRSPVLVICVDGPHSSSILKLGIDWVSFFLIPDCSFSLIPQHFVMTKTSTQTFHALGTSRRLETAVVRLWPWTRPVILEPFCCDYKSSSVT